jgi:hypothetical protein
MSFESRLGAGCNCSPPKDTITVFGLPARPSRDRDLAADLRLFVLPVLLYSGKFCLDLSLAILGEVGRPAAVVFLIISTASLAAAATVSSRAFDLKPVLWIRIRNNPNVLTGSESKSEQKSSDSDTD